MYGGDEELSPREIAQRKISAFYAKYFPEKMSQVSRLLDKYRGEEEDVIKTFRLKYQKWDWDYIPPPTHPQQHSHQHPPQPGLPSAAYAPQPSANTGLALSHPSIRATPGGGGGGGGYGHPPPADASQQHHIVLSLQQQQQQQGQQHGGYYAPPPQLPDGGTPPYSGGGGGGGYPGVTHPHPHAPLHGGDAVTRAEIENAFAALESKLTEAQRQDASVLENKLDQLLAQLHARGAPAALAQPPPPLQLQHRPTASARHEPQQPQLAYGGVGGGAPTPASPTSSILQQQLRDVVSKIDSLVSTANAPGGGGGGAAPVGASYPGVKPMTTPVRPAHGGGGGVGGGSEADVNLAELMQKVHVLEAQVRNAPASAGSAGPAVVPPTAGHGDFTDLMRQDNSRKSADLDAAAQGAQVLHAQMGEQQQRHVREMQQLQRKISELEVAKGGGGPTPQQLLLQMQQQQGPGAARQAPAGVSSAGPSFALANAGPSAGYASSPPANQDLKTMQDELEELRRRDDLSRKLIHEKQMLLDTMFALSHQQQFSGSPARGLVMPPPTAQQPSSAAPVSPGRGAGFASTPSQVHHHYHATPVWVPDQPNPGMQ